MKSKEKILGEVRAAFAHEYRINLHRYPIQIAFSNGDLVLEGEVEDIVAKKLALELRFLNPARFVSGRRGER